MKIPSIGAELSPIVIDDGDEDEEDEKDDWETGDDRLIEVDGEEEKGSKRLWDCITDVVCECNWNWEDCEGYTESK